MALLEAMEPECAKAMVFMPLHDAWGVHHEEYDNWQCSRLDMPIASSLAQAQFDPTAVCDIQRHQEQGR
jgi:hypothetical protein